MGEVSIINIIKESLGRGALEVPVFSPMALKLQGKHTKDDSSAEAISRVILKDQALASNVLKVANSAFYAELTPIKTIRNAIVRLGSKSIVNLVMLIKQKQNYHSQGKNDHSLMKSLWSHALGAGLAGRWFATRLGSEKLAEEAFMAGFLHDIGKLLLMRVIEDLQKSESIHQDIRAVSCMRSSRRCTASRVSC